MYKTIYKLINFIVVLFFIVATIPAQATEAHDKKVFQKIFSDWTAAFNKKELAASCHLFSKSVIADYQGTPQKNYASICNGFKKIFNARHQRYQYHFKLHHVYRSKNMAALRITWYLRYYKNNILQSQTQDEGIDIFEKNKLGQWQIVNYVGYPKIIKTKV